jgi:hypothetical protein
MSASGLFPSGFPTEAFLCISHLTRAFRLSIAFRAAEQQALMGYKVSQKCGSVFLIGRKGGAGSVSAEADVVTENFRHSFRRVIRFRSPPPPPHTHTEDGVGLVPKRGCLLTLAYYAFPICYEFGERRWNDILTGEDLRTRRKAVPVPLCLPQIPHLLTRARTRASTVRGRRLTTWAMARPDRLLWRHSQLNIYNYVCHLTLWSIELKTILWC